MNRALEALLLVVLLALMIVAFARGGPDPAPGSHHKARIDWTYSYLTVSRDGEPLRCTVYAKTGKRVCVVIP